MNKKYFILICLALLLLNACGGLKKIWVGPFSNNQTNLDYGAFIDSMKANRLKYEWINVRAKISSNDPNIPQKNLGLNIRSRKDSIIWLSISAKGISGLRVLMTQDSIKIINKIGKKYWIYPFDSIQKFISFPINFENVEDLIVGNPFLLDPNYYTSISKDKFVQLIYNYPRFKNSLNIGGDNYKMAAMYLEDKVLNQSLLIKQSEYLKVKNQQIAQSRDIQIVRKDSLFFNLKINRIKLDEKTSFPFRISQKYERAN